MNTPLPTPKQINDLQEFLRFRSISTQAEYREEMNACAHWLEKKLKSIGLAASIYETLGNPVVVAKTPTDVTKKTVLIYGHYDVQPPEPLENWISEPFDPVIRDGRIFARGATDNKGQIYAHIAGVEEALATEGDLPVNLIFLIEGEEEIGSPNLAAFLEANQELLRCDVVVISDTGMAAHGHPTLAYALRGVAALECKVKGPSQDLHSGVYGGAIMNPLTAAARLIASLHDDEGRVLIPRFYERVQPLADWEREETASAPTGDGEILAQTGAPALFGEVGFNSLERIGARPTAEVNGMGGGYQGKGTKTVLPKEAFFKLTFRLVADQKAQEILDLAEAHLRAHCPAGVTLEIERGHSGEPYFIDPNNTEVEAACRALKETFGRKPSRLREGGSIPILLEFRQKLGVNCLLLALASPDCNAHSPNENFPLENLGLGIALNRAVLKELAQMSYRGDVPWGSLERNRGAC